MKNPTNEKNTASLVRLASKEIEFINFHLFSQKRLHSKILKFLKSVVKDIDSLNNSQKALDVSSDLNSLSDSLIIINSNISFLDKLISTLRVAINTPMNIDGNLINIIEHFYTVNAKDFDAISEATVNIENLLETNAAAFPSGEAILKEINASLSNELFDSNFNSNDDETSAQELSETLNLKRELEENVLTISSERIVLPFTFLELDTILENNSDRYNCRQDVINDLYTKPASYYKKASIARFKEAFKLARNDKAPFNRAFDLALELFTNYNLHPAVITACKNLNELDVYLACLEYNELEDFKFFKVKFELALAKTHGSLNIFSKFKNSNQKLLTDKS